MEYAYKRMSDSSLIRCLRSAECDLFCDKITHSELDEMCKEIAKRYENLLKKCNKNTQSRTYCSDCLHYDVCKEKYIDSKHLTLCPHKLTKDRLKEENRCNRCKYYEGVHNVMGHAPCSYHNLGGVMWNECCDNFKKVGDPEEDE